MYLFEAFSIDEKKIQMYLPCRHKTAYEQINFINSKQLKSVINIEWISA